MRIGIDFDNTIVCYDPVFHIASYEKKLIPESIPATKEAVRDHLREIDREDDWTELQGYIYGTRMELAKPFPGIFDFLKQTINRGIDVFIISHKTQFPYRGPQYDLPAAARSWLETNGVFDPEGIGLSVDRAFFEPTKELKLERIGALGCTHFIDDLPEFLAEPGFPPDTTKILFEPGAERPVATPVHRAKSWADITNFLFGPNAGDTP